MSRLCRVAALIGYFALFGWLLLWLAWLEPSRQWPIALTLLVLTGPLLFPLRGLLYGRLRAHIWVGLLALFYFTVGVFYATGSMTRPWLAWLEVGISIALFLSSTLYAHTQVNRPVQTGGNSS